MTSRSPSPSKKSLLNHPEVFGRAWHWRSIFLISIVLKTYFSLSTSYIHPDEHFQGPEALADSVFGWATKKSWEFSGDAPARSYFVAWIVYGLPMAFIQVMLASSKKVDPIIVLYALRLVFSLGNWILSDMAIDRLTQSKQHRLAALFFYGTSYVSWTYQSHTFSNSVETVLLLWCLVIIHEFQTKRCSMLARHADAALLGCLVSFGIFNRVTFPAFLLIPGLRFLPWLLKHPVSLIIMALAFVFTSVLAIYVDTICFSIVQNLDSAGNAASAINQFMDGANSLRVAPTETKLVVAPLNNLLYNMNSANLALHGVHSRLQHLLVNLPELLGPALILLFSSNYFTSLPFQSAVSGLFILSFVQHQEVRFLVPVIPLLCCCLDFTVLANSKPYYRMFFITWFGFNIVMGALMGILHQGGIISAQVFISQMVGDGQVANSALHNSTQVPTIVDTSSQVESSVFLWWKTYSPPIWLLGKPVEAVEIIDPVETLAGGGDNVYRYQPVFTYLSEMEVSLGNSTDYSFLKGPSNVLHFNQTPRLTSMSSSSSYALPASTSSSGSLINTPIPTFPSQNAPPYLTVADLMGASPPILNEIMSRLAIYSSTLQKNQNQVKLRTYLVAPIAAVERNPFLSGFNESSKQLYTLNQVWQTRAHLSLDDLDFSDWNSLIPGLGIWEFTA